MLDILAVVQDAGETINLVVTAAVGVASSLLLGGTKKLAGKVNEKVGAVDTKVTNFIKPVQPLILMGLTWGLPKLGEILNVLPPDAGAVVSAPLAAVIGVVGREIVKRFLTPKTT